MTTYLLEVSLSLLVTFGFYKMALESQQMHGFKRFYLLGSLLFAALVPLVSFELEPTAALVDYQPARVLQMETPAASQQPELQPELEPVAVGFDYVACCTTYGFWLYGLVTTVLVGRFVVNLSRLMRQITTNPQQPFRGANLVLLATNTLPYTFLQYLFVSEAAYRRKEIEEEVFTHELTHIQQRHSLDVLLLEVLLCLAWFNPLLYGVRRAMQLNHEFLADEAVNERHRNVPRYQQLMLSKLTSGLRVSLTSAFTFQTTKKRFLMMSKSTSRTRAWLVGGSATLLLGALTFVLGTNTEPAISSAPENHQATERRAFEPEAEKVVRQHGDLLVALLNGKGGKSAVRRYSELSAAEKQRVTVKRTSHFLPLKVPTEAQWVTWKNSGKYRASVHSRRQPEGVLLEKKELNNYQRVDISSFVVAYDYRHNSQGTATGGIDSTKRLVVMWTKERREEILKGQRLDTMPRLFLSEPTAWKTPGQQPETVVESKEPVHGSVPVLGRMERKYADLSAEEKQRVTIFKIPLQPRRTPTEAQWTEWQNPRKFGIWVDGKRLQGQTLGAAYQRTDIVAFMGSYVHKNARQPEGYLYQMDLITKQGYEQEQRSVAESPQYGMLLEDQPKRRKPGF